MNGFLGQESTRNEFLFQPIEELGNEQSAFLSANLLSGLSLHKAAPDVSPVPCMHDSVTTGSVVIVGRIAVREQRAAVFAQIGDVA